VRVEPGKHDLQAAVRAGGKDTAAAARGRGRPASFELRRGLEPEDNVGVAKWDRIKANNALYLNRAT
jgi:hypothetical protein